VVAVIIAVSLEVQYGIPWWSIPMIHELERLSSFIWKGRIMLVYVTYITFAVVYAVSGSKT
jgi:hypothetical protein